MKKIVFSFLFFLIFSQIAFAASDERFQDVVDVHPNDEAIHYLKSSTVISGYSDGSFKPDQTINRAEFLKIVIAAAFPEASGSNCFSDVADQWFAKYACYAKEKGIVSGYSDGSFKPDQNISFVEAGKVIVNAFQLSSTSGEGAWYAPYVRALEKNKAIPVSIDYLEKSVTRGEMSEIVWRLKAKKSNKATKTFASMQKDFPQIGSCEELQEKMQMEYYKSRRNSFFMMEDAVEMRSAEAPLALSQDASKSSASSYSETNVQVAGVDEADVVKNDGKYIYLIEGTNVHIIEAYPPENMQQIGTISFEDVSLNPSSLYLFGDKLVVIGGHYDYGESFYQSHTKLFVYDVSNPSNPVVVRESQFDGNMISSRRIDDRVYLVMNLYPYYQYSETGDVEDILPMYEDSLSGVSGPMVTCTDIRFFPRYESPQFLIVASVPIDAEGAESTIEKEVFLGAGDTVYASLDSIYVAMNRYFYNENVRYDLWNPEISTTSTALYRFSLDDGGVNYQGQGMVPGTLLNQFSMDEYGDTFRLATTTNAFGSRSSNHLYVLDRDNLETIRGKIVGIAPGESIYSVRFVGERAYMVTFQKIDPFFVIDLSNPDDPAILGALKIPGFSDYLHPYDETHILGFGKDTVAPEELIAKGIEPQFSWYQGMKIALFDVSDVANPKQMFVEVIGDRGTESPLLYDHKALLFDREKELLAFPVRVAEISDKKKDEYTGDVYGETVFSGAYVYTLNLQDGFKLRGAVTHYDQDSDVQTAYDYGKEISRMLFMDESLYSVSPAMVKASVLSDVSPISEVEWEVESPQGGYYIE